MSDPVPPLMEIERLLTQVVVVVLTIAGASLTRRGIYAHDPDAITGGCALALIWVATILFARYRQGPTAWWLLVSAPVVLAMPMTNLISALLA